MTFAEATERLADIQKHGYPAMDMMLRVDAKVTTGQRTASQWQTKKCQEDREKIAKWFREMAAGLTSATREEETIVARQESIAI